MQLFSEVGFFAGGLAQYLIPFIFVLTIIVFFHELGHFLVGRWCGAKIDSFSIGFGPEIFAFVDRQGTRWRCAAIPLGGYVKFHGDINGASVPDSDMLAALTPEERKVTFAALPLWRRFAIVAAGPMASFLLAIAIFSTTLFVSGQWILPPRIQQVQGICPQLSLSLPARLDLQSLDKPLYASAVEFQRAQSTAAEEAGLRSGDLILSIDGQKIDSFADIQAIVSASNNEPLSFEVQRGQAVLHLTATPRGEITTTLLGERMTPRLGIEASNDPKDLRVERLSVGRAVAVGSYQTWQIVERTSTFLGRLFSGRESADQVSGPIGIAAMSGEMAKVGLGTLLNLVAILSASIGFFNLLPIPLLDGGHLLYYLIEAVRGRPLSLRAQELGFRMGLAIVGLLMVFATSNDLLRVIPELTKRLGIGG